MVNLLQTYGRLQAHAAPQGAGVYILAQSIEINKPMKTSVK